MESYSSHDVAEYSLAHAANLAQRAQIHKSRAAVLGTRSEVTHARAKGALHVFAPIDMSRITPDSAGSSHIPEVYGIIDCSGSKQVEVVGCDRRVDGGLRKSYAVNGPFVRALHPANSGPNSRVEKM
jgi:hypothetical protein